MTLVADKDVVYQMQHDYSYSALSFNIHYQHHKLLQASVSALLPQSYFRP